MPKSIASECENFVNTYGDLIIAMVIHDADPAQVNNCPLTNLSNLFIVVDKVDSLFH